jgi:Sulfotransferase domain
MVAVKFIMSHFESQNPNFSGFVVFGAGLPRTGTSSLRMALAELVVHVIKLYTFVIYECS